MGPGRRTAWLLGALAGLLLAGCAETQLAVHVAKQAVNAADDTDTGAPSGARVKVGRPYQVAGVWYYPKVQPGYDETGIASWYGDDFHGRHTANGEVYDMNALTAAHKTLPMPSRVRVTNLENGRSIVVRVNDRGPFAHGRIIDLSRRASQLLGFYRAGTAKVRVTLVEETKPVMIASTDEMPALPRGNVEAESLPPPQGVRAAKPRSAAAKPVRIADAAPRLGPTEPVASPRTAPAGPAPVAAVGRDEDDTVNIVPVRPTEIYVQAGAFLRYDNANRLRARLAGYGPAKITNAVIDDQEFFRVRVGPLRSVDAADRMLARVIGGGFTDARIVVD